MQLVWNPSQSDFKAHDLPFILTTKNNTPGHFTLCQTLVRLG